MHLLSGRARVCECMCKGKQCLGLLWLPWLFRYKPVPRLQAGHLPPSPTHRHREGATPGRDSKGLSQGASTADSKPEEVHQTPVHAQQQRLTGKKKNSTDKLRAETGVRPSPHCPWFAKHTPVRRGYFVFYSVFKDLLHLLMTERREREERNGDSLSHSLTHAFVG